MTLKVNQDNRKWNGAILQMSKAVRLCLVQLWPPCVADADITFLPCSLLWPPYVTGQAIYIFILWFPSIYLSFFISSPNLSGHKLDVYHTSAHGVALVRIKNAGLKCADRGSLQIQDAKKSPKIAIWAPSHKFNGLYLRN